MRDKSPKRTAPPGLTEGQKVIGWVEHIIIGGDGTALTVQVDPLTESTLQQILEAFRSKGWPEDNLETFEMMFVCGYHMGRGQNDLERAIHGQ